MALMEDNLQLAEQIAMRMRGYQRLLRNPDVRVEEVAGVGAGPDVGAETVAILHDDARETHLELGAEGFALWNLIDGFRSMEDLTLACAETFQDPSRRKRARAGDHPGLGRVHPRQLAARRRAGPAQERAEAPSLDLRIRAQPTRHGGALGARALHEPAVSDRRRPTRLTRQHRVGLDLDPHLRF